LNNTLILEFFSFLFTFELWFLLPLRNWFIANWTLLRREVSSETDLERRSREFAVGRRTLMGAPSSGISIPSDIPTAVASPLSG